MAKRKLKDNIQTARYINDFLHVYARKHQTSSDHTLKSYEMTLKSYMTFLEKEKKITPRDFTLNCFKKQLILEWLDWLQNKKNLTPQTCNVRLSNLRTFLKYVKDQDPGAASLYYEALDVKRRPAVKPKVHGLSKQALQTLFSLPDKTKQTGRRDLIFMYLAYATAMRMSEILNLKIKDLHLEEERPYVSILGKGNKERTMYLVSSTVRQLEGYIKEFHGKDPNPEDYLFYSRNKGRQAPLSAEAVKKMLYKYGQKGHQKCKEIPENLHCHQFRHSRATHWMEDGFNLMQISFMLGHSNLETTAVYLDLTKEEAMKAMKVLEEQENEDYIKKANEQEETLMGFTGLDNSLAADLDYIEDL